MKLREKDDAQDFAGLLLVGHRRGAGYVGRRRRDDGTGSTVVRSAGDDGVAAGAADLPPASTAGRRTGDRSGRGFDDADGLLLLVVLDGRSRSRQRAVARRRESDAGFPDEPPALPGHADRRLSPSLLLQRHVLVLIGLGLSVVVGEIDRVETALVGGQAAVLASAAGRVVAGTATTADPGHELLLVLAGLVAQQVDR